MHSVPYILRAARALTALTTLVFGLALPAPSTAQQTASVDSLAQAFKATTNLPGLIVGVATPTEMRVLPYGVSALNDSSKVHDGTVFEIGSLTKVFTGLLLAEMAERRVVRLNDPVSAYLPDSVRIAPADTARITLQHLSTHTSGLARLPGNLAPANPADPYADYTAADLYAFLQDAQPSRAPGAAYAYSNVGTGLLGHLLARHADTSYEAMLQQRILDPLGLHDTGFDVPPDSAASHHATGYASGRAVPYWTFDVLAGAGALRSTAPDMLRFLQMNLRPEGQPLASALRAAQTVHHRGGGGPTLALGWHVAPLPTGAPLYWHNGGTGGFRSFAGFVQDGSVAVVVLANGTLPLQQFNRFAFQVMHAALNENT